MELFEEKSKWSENFFNGILNLDLAFVKEPLYSKKIIHL